MRGIASVVYLFLSERRLADPNVSPAQDWAPTGITGFLKSASPTPSPPGLVKRWRKDSEA